MIVVNVSDSAAEPGRSAQLSSCLDTNGKLGTEEEVGLPVRFFRIRKRGYSFPDLAHCCII